MTVLTLTIVNREKNVLLMTRGKTSFYTYMIHTCMRVCVIIYCASQRIAALVFKIDLSRSEHCV